MSITPFDDYSDDELNELDRDDLETAAFQVMDYYFSDRPYYKELNVRNNVSAVMSTDDLIFTIRASEDELISRARETGYSSANPNPWWYH